MLLRSLPYIYKYASISPVCGRRTCKWLSGALQFGRVTNLHLELQVYYYSVSLFLSYRTNSEATPNWNHRKILIPNYRFESEVGKRRISHKKSWNCARFKDTILHPQHTTCREKKNVDLSPGQLDEQKMCLVRCLLNDKLWPISSDRRRQDQVFHTWYRDKDADYSSLQHPAWSTQVDFLFCGPWPAALQSLLPNGNHRSILIPMRSQTSVDFLCN